MLDKITLVAIPDIPLIKEGDDIGEIIYQCSQNNNLEITKDDIIVVAQKIVSKAEGAVVHLEEINPSKEALKLAKKTGRDARLCQVYLDEAEEILEVKGRMVVTKHRLGFECTSAGVDRSNIALEEHKIVTLLPANPDESARRIRDTIKEKIGKRVAVIINDSFGRHDREGSYGVTIGIAGISPLEIRKQEDLFGNERTASIALIDEVAGAASVLMGQGDERRPAILAKNINYTVKENTTIQDILIN